MKFLDLSGEWREFEVISEVIVGEGHFSDDVVEVLFGEVDESGQPVEHEITLRFTRKEAADFGLLSKHSR